MIKKLCLAILSGILLSIIGFFMWAYICSEYHSYYACASLVFAISFSAMLFMFFFLRKDKTDEINWLETGERIPKDPLDKLRRKPFF